MNQQQNTVEIIHYEDRYHDILKKLTLEWLEGFILDKEDVAFMDDPKSYVLDGGGFIFLAKYNGEIVGTVSLLKVTEQQYELEKLCVTPQYKGLKLGKKLVEYAMGKCKEVGASQVVLYTTKRLAVAYQLYLNLGFYEIEQAHRKFLEAEVMMCLDLKK